MKTARANQSSPRYVRPNAQAGIQAHRFLLLADAAESADLAAHCNDLSFEAYQAAYDLGRADAQGAMPALFAGRPLLINGWCDGRADASRARRAS